MIFRNISKSVLFFVFGSVVVTIIFVGQTEKAHAFPPISSSAAPAYVAADALNHCGPNFNWSVYQTQWLSEQNNPSVTAISVPYGTTVIPLQLNWITYRCQTTNPATTAGNYIIDDTVPKIVDIIGQTGQVVYLPPGVVGPNYGTGLSAASGGHFNYNTPAPVVANQKIHIDLITRGTITSNGSPQYTCSVVSQTDKGGTASRADDFKNCSQEIDGFDIDVTVTPPTNVSCNISISPVKPVGGQTITATETVSWLGSFAPQRPNYIMGINGIINNNDIDYFVSPGQAVNTTSLTVALPPGVGTHVLNGSFVGPGISAVCTKSVDVTANPYFKVGGGDITAGASFATEDGAGIATPCSKAPHIEDAGIVSWNHHGKDSNGAGGQYGAFGYNFIQDFVTGQGNGQIASGTETNELTFSNQNYNTSPKSVTTTNGMFGGMFGSGPCIDYWNDRPTALKLLPVGGLSSGTPSDIYYVNGSLTLNSVIIPAGKHITVYVKGDVAIAGDISYALYGSRKDIPSFKLIVNGTIFIGAGVNKLDGTYAAIPDTDAFTAGLNGGPSINDFGNPNAGTIATCSQSTALPFKSYNPLEFTINGMATACNKQLVVTGSLVAEQIWLLRTYGTLDGAPVAPAEVLNYSPEVWLSGDTGSVRAGDYQSIIGLPPVL